MTTPTYNYGLFSNITASALVYTGAGAIQGVIVNSHTNGTVKFEDALTDTTPIITNTFTFPSGSGSYNFFGAKFKTGLYAVISGTADITIVYTPYKG